MLNSKFVTIAVAIFCIPLGIVTTLQVEHLQPEWVWWGVRWLLALTAGLSWSGGIAISFYLRALYGNSVPLLLIGGLGMGAFYGTYYTGTAGAWFGPAYAALTAAFDFLWLERVLHCVGKAQKEQAGVETIKVNMPLAVLAAQKELQAEKNRGKLLDNERKGMQTTVTETHTRQVIAPLVQEPVLAIAPAKSARTLARYNEFANAPNAKEMTVQQLAELGVPLRTAYNWFARLHREA